MSVSGAVFAVKGALTAMTDERVRTAVLSVTAAICIPFFLIISVMLCSLSGTADHNRQAVFLSFYGSGISLKMPEEYRSYIRDMQESFQDLDREIGKINKVFTMNIMVNVCIFINSFYNSYFENWFFFSQFFGF